MSYRQLQLGSTEERGTSLLEKYLAAIRKHKSQSPGKRNEHMGMFDQLNPFSEHFKEGEFFTLLDTKVGNEIETEYGSGTPAQLKIKTKDGEEWFSAFGQALVNQITRMERGDLPAEVAMVRVKNKAGTYEYKVLATKEQVENDELPF